MSGLACSFSTVRPFPLAEGSVSARQLFMRDAPAQRAPQRIRPPTRRVALIVGDHVARAHRAAGYFPAVALAIADLHRPSEAAILRPIELCGERNCLVVRPIAQI